MTDDDLIAAMRGEGGGGQATCDSSRDRRSGGAARVIPVPPAPSAPHGHPERRLRSSPLHHRCRDQACWRPSRRSTARHPIRGSGPARTTASTVRVGLRDVVVRRQPRRQDRDVRRDRWLAGKDLYAAMYERETVPGINPFTGKPVNLTKTIRALGKPYEPP